LLHSKRKLQCEEVEQKYKIGVIASYLNKKVTIVSYHQFIYNFYNPGVNIEWWNKNDNLCTEFISYNRLRFLKVK
jgi:hypothetical protein